MLSQSLEWQKQGYVSMSVQKKKKKKSRNFVGNFLLSTNRSSAGRKKDRKSKNSKKLLRKSKNWKQTKPNQRNKNKEIPGPDSLNLLQGRQSNLGESHRLKQQQKQQLQQQAWRATPNLVLMMIDHSSTSPGNAIEFRRSTEDEEEQQPRPTQNL